MPGSSTTIGSFFCCYRSYIEPMSYRLYVDEVGNDDLGNVADARHRYLSLTGVAIRHDHVRDHATPNMNQLKSDIFKQHDPDSPIILHRKDIMNKRGPFGVLNEPDMCATFDKKLIEYLRETNYTVFTCLIDKKGMLTQTHWRQNHPYHYLMEILVEKYVQWLERRGSTGDIMPEMRRGQKDKALQRAYNRVRSLGTYYVSASRMHAALPAKQLKFRGKEANITGLQICDLVAHPSHMDIRRSREFGLSLGAFAREVIPLLRELKYDRSPYNPRTISGYGMKYLP
jgi:hypothetical protein